MKRFLWHKLASREEETQRHLGTVEFGRVPGVFSLEEAEGGKCVPGGVIPTASPKVQEAATSGLESWLGCFLAVGLWASHIPSLSRCFPVAGKQVE